jgi:1-acyl-sn-glycerol-3-phosphate acyltransferase
VWYLINTLQILIIALWTAFCAFFGLFMALILGSRSKGLYIDSHYAWSPFILAVSFVKVKHIGRENLRHDESFIYVANHESQMDIPAIYRAVTVPLFFIGKKELKKVPFVGQFMTLIGMIFIDRKNREKAYQSLKEAGELIKGGRSVMSFPEGTRNKDGKMKLFKRGSFKLAIQADIGVVPLSVHGAREVLASGSMKIRPGTITVKIGKPIYHRDHPEMDADEFAGYVRGMVLEMRNS